MTNLMSAHLFRLKKSRLFWGCLVISAAAGAWQSIQTFLEHGPTVPLDSIFFVYTMLIGLLLAVFLPLFFGAEYSDGAIRNKLAVGHSRSAVYLANLAVCSAAGVLACLSYILPITAAGIPLLGPFTMSTASLLWFTLCAFLMTAALCAVFTMIAMLNQNKAVVAVICISLAYFLLFLGIYLNSRLGEQAVIPAREYIENGQILVQEAMPNPTYVRGVKRTIFQLLCDLPGCQAVQLLAAAEERPWRLPAASLGAILASSAAGLALFRRKDLK